MIAASFLPGTAPPLQLLALPSQGIWINMIGRGLAEAAFGIFTFIPWALGERISLCAFSWKTEFSLFTDCVFNLQQMPWKWDTWPKAHSLLFSIASEIDSWNGRDNTQNHTARWALTDQLTNPSPHFIDAKTEVQKRHAACRRWDSKKHRLDFQDFMF